jgi:hypothetical protein
MRTWLVVLLVLVGCRKGEMPRGSAINGTPIPGCWLDSEPTREQLGAVYNRWPQDIAGGGRDPYGDVRAMSLSELDRGVIELQSRPCCDFPLRHLGYAWHCNMFRRREDVAMAIVNADGWQTADRKKRIEIATSVSPILANDLTEQPEDWNPYKPFRLRAVEALPDGGVKVTRWVLISDGGGSGGPMYSYALQEDTISPTATHASKELERYTTSHIGYADPKVLASCDPTRPPTKEWIYAELVDARRAYRGLADKLIIEHVYEDVWVASESVYEGAPRTLQYFRRCKVFEDRVAVVPSILETRGWTTADPAKRIALATEIDAFVYRPLATPDADWPEAHPFVAPTSQANADGSVLLSRWTLGGLDNDVPTNLYARIDTVYSATGTIVQPWKMHDSFGMYSKRR